MGEAQPRDRGGASWGPGAARELARAQRAPRDAARRARGRAARAVRDPGVGPRLQYIYSI